ncbi:hypothetical protein GQ54DRAFT_297794 [Martensiomyces pterosporus]|nr:hypothetical protein GQ54DRAFT_297794 [Martensiomyces pterosporus]
MLKDVIIAGLIFCFLSWKQRLIAGVVTASTTTLALPALLPCASSLVPIPNFLNFPAQATPAKDSLSNA